MPATHHVRRPGFRSLLTAATSLLVTALVVGVPVLRGSDAPPSSSGRAAAAPTSSAKSSAPAPCRNRPNTFNTGARGALVERGITKVGSGRTLENVRVPSLEIVGSDVTIRNVQVDGTVLVRGDRVRIRRVTSQGIGISSASNVSVKRSKIESSPDDAFHVTSDDGRLVRDVKLRYNFVHRPVAPSDNHYDGVQVRGVDGMEISCSTFRAGRYHENFNAAIFLENANGGSSNVIAANNWLFGYAFSIMVDSPSATFTGNRIGGDIKWGPCLLLESSGSGGFESSGNIWAGSGKRVNFCGQG